jgi:hypothetical protein
MNEERGTMDEDDFEQKYTQQGKSLYFWGDN